MRRRPSLLSERNDCCVRFEGTLDRAPIGKVGEVILHGLINVTVPPVSHSSFFSGFTQ